jgi:hypothetical protein
MVTISLDPGELACVRMIAAYRELACAAAKLTDPHFSPDPFGDKVAGVTAEIAYAKWANVFPDLTAPATAHSYDVLHDGVRVDIKAVTHSDHRLIAPRWKQVDSCDLYVLALVCGAEVTLLGWVRSGDFITPANLKNVGHGDCYVMTRDQLRRLDESLSEGLPIPVTQ